MIKRIATDDIPEETITADCLWYKNYSVLPSELECILTYCDNATEEPNDNGANYNFTWDGEVILLNSDVVYPCQDYMMIENDTYYRYDASNTSIVHCASDGFLKYPTVWPQCSLYTYCGQPPEPPVGGSRLWLTGDEGDDYSGTEVIYRCINGSEFDTNNDGDGNSFDITISCRWNKDWDPWPVLPPCYITDCVDPYSIPEDTYLEEVTTEWTRVNDSKQYRCQGMEDSGLHTMFWESNRSLSTFSMFCQPDGHFLFEDLRENWPTCLEGNFFVLLFITDIFCLDISCDPLPPMIPTHDDYILPSDDGHVIFSSLVYPELTLVEGVYNSSYNNTEIPRNYMANLT